MNIKSILSALRQTPDFMNHVAAWEQLPAREAVYGELPFSLPDDIIKGLASRGTTGFYTHQVAALTAVNQGQNVVVATTTASGKSLCYMVPTLHKMVASPIAQALYLFPTKALAHDQVAEMQSLIQATTLPLSAHTYDGDTPRHQRPKIRQKANIIISNPDMLHASILPQHTRWRHLFANLSMVVIDEIHTYRGVFGSHLANVLRRLQRLCAFYGSSPQFICCSATIANPREHAEQLVELPFTLIDESQNGAPTGQSKHFIIYNPPLIDAQLGLRQSTIMAAKDAAITFLARQTQTVIFARARQTVELLLAYLQDEMVALGQSSDVVTGYRGGYLPLERRNIEEGLRTNRLWGVVATNALELGIDIGYLQAAILTGYPGSISATWQQAGRAGRGVEDSAVILIAGSNPLDQYLCQHTHYLFDQSPEQALINANNLPIMAAHLQCAAYELPFTAGDSYGHYGDVTELLEALVESAVMHKSTRRQSAKFHWLGDGLPTQTLSLRTSGQDTVVIQTMGEIDSPPNVIGQVDIDSAPLLVHEGAVYMHLAQTYLVERLDWENRLAEVRPTAVDYYTRAQISSHIRELLPVVELTENDVLFAHGDISVTRQAVGYRIIKRYTQETLGFGDIDLPEMTLETGGYWFVFGKRLTDKLVAEGILLAPNDYGPNWDGQRQLALQRDGYACQVCQVGAADSVLHVHHIRPFREFNYIRGQNDTYLEANQLANLTTVCPRCHRRVEQGQRSRSGLGGLAYLLGHLAPLYLMCAPGDIQVSVEHYHPLTKSPTVVIYERVMAGVGFCQRLFEQRDELLQAALVSVEICPCIAGCPACVGPPADIGANTKNITYRLIQSLV